MKNAIKLLVLAGALLSVGALAQQSTTQDWHFSFPKYAYIYTNTSDVTFDFTDDTADGTASTLSLYPAAGLSELQNCIDNFVNGLSTINAGASSPNNPSACGFAPSGVTKSGYNVDWGSGNTADGSLLVVTNASGYEVSVRIDAILSGVTYKVAPKLTSSVAAGDFISLTTTDADFASDSVDFNTQYNGVFVIPLAFAAEVLPNTAATTGQIDSIVTYTVSAQ